ncbi:DUF2512 family protein [Aneurinibacillus sp. BA2021]|nr:DUF2512 family protein [Aneurinibacillus sp. BA2021]
MTSFLMKVVTCPLAIILASFLFPNVNYSNFAQPIIVGVILALAGTMLEYLFLREGTLWLSTGADFVASILVIYLVSQFFYGARVTLMGAVATSLIIAAVEFFVHSYLINSGQTRKSPA